MYNLSDIIRFKQQHGVIKKFKDRICYEYLTIQGPPYNNSSDSYQHFDIDFKCLQNIVKKRARKPAREDTFAMHIRAFDCLRDTTRFPGFPSPEDFFKVITKYNINDRFKKCLLVYGNHKPQTGQGVIDNTYEYIERIKSGIEKFNISCELVSEDPDQDFITLATAKCYIAGYRGFAWLAASINPNEVIWDIQNPPEFPWLGNRKNLKGLQNGYKFYCDNKTIK